MTKTWLVATLLLATALLAVLPPPRAPGQSRGSMVLAVQSPIPSPITTQAEKACPAACSVRLTATEDRLQAQIDEIREAMNHDIPILNDRTLDLHERLKKLEGKAGWDRAMAELNDLDARVVQLERPEPEDEAK